MPSSTRRATGLQREVGSLSTRRRSPASPTLRRPLDELLLSNSRSEHRPLRPAFRQWSRHASELGTPSSRLEGLLSPGAAGSHRAALASPRRRAGNVLMRASSRSRVPSNPRTRLWLFVVLASTMVGVVALSGSFGGKGQSRHVGRPTARVAPIPASPYAPAPPPLLPLLAGPARAVQSSATTFALAYVRYRQSPRRPMPRGLSGIQMQMRTHVDPLADVHLRPQAPRVYAIALVAQPSGFSQANVTLNVGGVPIAFSLRLRLVGRRWEPSQFAPPVDTSTPSTTQTPVSLPMSKVMRVGLSAVPVRRASS